MEVKPEQPSKAAPPIDVTLLGMMTEVKSEQYEKASSPMDVTLYVCELYSNEEGIIISPLY